MENYTTYIVSGYTLELYCNKCKGKSWKDIKSSGLIDIISIDGSKCYSNARKIARKRGWILHKDGTATCKNCR